MSNFVEVFKQGKAGRNVGLPTGIPKLDKALHGLQKKMSLGIAAAPKVGKTTLADFTCVLSPFLHFEELEKKRLGVEKLNYWVETTVEGVDHPVKVLYWTVDKESHFHNIEWIYFSFEIDRVSKEFKFASFFMAHDYGAFNFSHKGKVYPMNPDYLMGKMIHDNPDGSTEVIPIGDDHEKMLKEIYLNRIIPIFGEYDVQGRQVRPGKIIYVTDPENPTGLNKYLLHYADLHGEFKREKYFVKEDGKQVEKERLVSYVEKNPNKYTIIITDHARKLRRERGFTMKENIDKWLEYSTILRNLCYYTFIHIIHSNRGVANVDRLRFAGEFIFPTGDDVKDTGNVSEECTALLTMFNPNDEKYNLDKHFGVDLTDEGNSNYRSLHLVESRQTECPQHIQIRMFGGINNFVQLESYGT